MVEPTEKIYSILCPPLASTVCHSKKFPRASVASHLSAVDAKLQDQVKKLQNLQARFEDCCRNENML